MGDCIFCDIISGKLPSYTIYENEELKVILDRFPANVGDILIIPKVHSDNIYDIDPALCGRLYTCAVNISKLLRSTLEFEGLNVLQNNGILAGQTINHFHIHLIGRYSNDKITFHYDTTDPTNDEFENVMQKLKEKL